VTIHKHVQTIGIFGVFAVLAAGSGEKTESKSTGVVADKPAEARPTPSDVDIKKLLSEYKDNEVRADGQFKGKWVRLTGVAGAVKKGITDDIYLTVGTGAQFEHPEVQCFIADGGEEKAAAVSQGKKITITGMVDGLMMNVLVKDCVIE
jgi:tRNA_anti-like